MKYLRLIAIWMIIFWAFGSVIYAIVTPVARWVEWETWISSILFLGSGYGLGRSVKKYNS
jgi:hypothetical protein